MVQVNWSLEAQEDVFNIFQYWSQFTVEYARNLMEEMFSLTDLLELTPAMGAIETSFKNPKHEYRFLVIQKRYKVVYMYENNVCDILIVWDCRRNPQLLKTRIRKNNQL